jgi:hypothetical protein
MEITLVILLNRMGVGKKRVVVIMQRSGRAAGSMGVAGKVGMGRRAVGPRLGTLGMFWAQARRRRSVEDPSTRGLTRILPGVRKICSMS